MSETGNEVATAGGVRVEALEYGAIWRVALATPKANILDGEKMEAIAAAFERAREERGLKAVLIEGEGPHFSFGASVPEHLPGKFEKMIPTFHTMFHRMLDASVPILAAVRGQCLGGGLELASFCHRVFAAPDAKLGQPEIVLGVFAPIASVILPERMGRARAEDVCLSGRILGAEEAHAVGLVDEIADDPSEAALGYARRHFLPRSAASLRLAVRASRVDWTERLRAAVGEAERLYVDELMATEDAVEGLTAFQEKRDPVWKNA
jgi:cyclohexa-1,5-dienecarbonyl-CoA hydratase